MDEGGSGPDPEAVTTGPPGSNAGPYARYARWWSDLCLLC